MFFKKKDKGGAEESPPSQSKAPSAPAPAAPQPAPAPAQARAPAPPPAASAPSPQAAQRPSTPPAAGTGKGAAIHAALSAAAGRAGAPGSAESLAAQKLAADALADGDPAARAIGADLVAGQFDKGFTALRTLAEGAGPAAGEKWRLLGQLAFNVDAARAKFAYEMLFNLHPRRFWDCIFLARLRGIHGQRIEAREAADAALAAAGGDLERGIAHVELGLIAMSANEARRALQHAEQAVALGRKTGPGPGGERDAIGRVVLLGDAALRAGDIARARTVYAEALAEARKLGAANPTDTTLARGVCEMLEKTAAAAAMDKAHDIARASLEEALNIRRKLLPVLAPIDGQRGLVQSLNLRAETAIAAGDAAAATAALEESLGVARQISADHPGDPMAQRNMWTVMWRMAQMQSPGVGWREVAQTMERMLGAGALDPEGVQFLDEARKRAAA